MAKLTSAQINIVSSQIATEINEKVTKYNQDQLEKFKKEYKLNGNEVETLENIKRYVSNTEKIKFLQEENRKYFNLISKKGFYTGNFDNLDSSEISDKLKELLFDKKNKKIRNVSSNEVAVLLILTDSDFDYDAIVKKIESKLFSK